jgi:hypothetical protein
MAQLGCELVTGKAESADHRLAAAVFVMGVASVHVLVPGERG